MRSKLWILFVGALLLTGCSGCSELRGDQENGEFEFEEPDVEDSFDADAAPIEDTAPLADADEGYFTIVVSQEAHPVMPEGWAGGESWTVTLSRAGGVYRGQTELPAGVVSLEAPGWGESFLDPIFRPLEGGQSLSALPDLRFLLPVAEEVALEVEGEIITIERLNQGSPGVFFDEAILRLTDEEDHVEVIEELQTSLREFGVGGAEGSPIRSGEPGLFFAGIGSEDGIPPDLRGTFNEWGGGEAYEWRQIHERLWGRFVQGIEGHHAYKITYGDGASWFTDFANPHIDWDGVETSGLGAFNSIINPLERPPGTGRLVWLPRVYSPELGNTREVYVYLPATYDTDEGERRLLIVHDGNESIGRGKFHEVADEAGADMILAFVALASQDHRMDEYTMAEPGSRGESYGEFLVETLLPLLESRFEIGVGRESRGLAGASLGGLISFWVASQHPEVFGFAGGMSSSFFWADEHMLAVIEELGCQDIKYYLDSGSPQDNYQVTLAMQGQLEELECDYTYVLEEGGLHEWSYWRARFGNVLEAFGE